MLRRFLGPFLSSPAASRREVALWSLLLLGAPLALAAAFQLHEMENARRRMTVTVSREQALTLAREQARELHLDVRGWKDFVAFDYNEDLALYAHSRFRDRPPGQRKGPPPGEAGRKGGDRRWGPDARAGGPPPGGITELRVTLVEPGRDRFVRVRMNSRGRIVGWQLGGAGAAQNVPPAPPEEAQLLAETTFAKWLGEQEAERLGEPEMRREENIAGGSGYEFTWRARNPRLPDTEYAVKVQVQGRRVIGLEGSLNFSESYQENVVAPRSMLVTTVTTLRLLLIVACVCYACWRYTRRSLEGEAPHQRMLGLAAAFALSGLLILLLDSTFAAPQMEASLSRPGIEAVLIISSIAMFVLMGLMLGISYGSGEGEIREAFPGKMTAADCLLTGRLYNRNVGRAVVLGAAITGWCFLLLSAISAGITGAPPHVPEAQLGYAFGRYPMLMLLFNVPVSGVFVVVTGLLLPLTFLRRHIHNRTLLFVLLGIGALLGSNIAEAPTQGAGNFLAEVIPIAVALLAGFFAGDLLTSIVACAALSLLSLMADLTGLIPYWQQNQWMVLALALLPLAVLGLGAWSNRSYGEEEVRPKHAANLASRLQMQAEVSAARQAQARLMPDGPPEIPGLSIAASCTPAREVSGDFFDFLPMANGGLAVVTGEGGNDGLASALTIALTKGYLLYRTQQPGGSAQSPRAILTRLDQVLGTMLRRESGQTSLALVCVDPVRRTCAMARVGRWPQVLLLRGDNTVEEVSPREGEQPLGADDAIVIVTDGIAKLLERSSGESPTEVLRRAGAAAKSESAARLHDEFLAAARASTRGAEVGDDITTVVLCLKRAESGHLESAA